MRDTAQEQKRLAGVSQGCTLNSDCNNPLVCAFQRCHVACTETRDCPPGQRCVAGPMDTKNVCLLPEEENCVTDSGCNGDQICATDRECRDPCDDDSECIGSQVCATSGACAEPTEVDASGNLPVVGAGGTGGMGGRGGAGGKGGKSGGGAGGSGMEAGQGG